MREVGTARVGSPEVRAEEVDGVQPGVAQVGAQQQRAPQVGPGEVEPAQVGADEVRTRPQAAARAAVRHPVPDGVLRLPPVVPLGVSSAACRPRPGVRSVRTGRTARRGAPGRVAHERARAVDQRPDVTTDGADVEREEVRRRELREGRGPVEGPPCVVVHGRGGGQRQHLGEVPEQLVELRDDGERRERVAGGGGVVAPRRTVVRGPDGRRHALAGPQAVVRDAAGEPGLAQPRVDAAAEVVAQVRARGARGLVDREVGGAHEVQPHAAQAGAARAVAAQVELLDEEGATVGRGNGWHVPTLRRPRDAGHGHIDRRAREGDRVRTGSVSLSPRERHRPRDRRRPVSPPRTTASAGRPR